MILETLVRQAIADPLHSPLALPATPGAGTAPLGQAPQGATLPPHAFLYTGASATPVVGTPAAARGMVLSATPAPGENGLTGQILTIAPISFVAIRRGAGGPVIGYLHATRTSQTGGVPRVFTYGPGSLWLTATTFSPQAPANGFMGIAFQSLELSIPGAIISVPLGNDILIDPAATLGVSLVPASPGGISGFSNDGTATTVILPATIGFALPPVGVATVQLGDAHVTTCGTTLALGGGSIATNWDAPPGEMVFTYRSTTPATFAASGSTLRGSASMLIGQYRLAVAETTPTALAAAASGGVPCILLSRGLIATWRDGRTLGLDTTLLLAQQGNLGVRAAIRQRGFTDGYALWTAPGPPPKPTRLTFTIPAGAVLVLSLSAAVEAAWVLGASLQAALDRPITVAGVPPKFSQLVFDYGVERTQAGTSLTVFGLPRPPPPVIAVPPPPVEVFAIENALLRTAGIVWLWGLMSLNGTQANTGLLIAGQVLTDLMPTLPDPYASSVDPLARQSVPAGLLTEIGWASETLVELGFTLLPPLANPAAIGAPPVLLLDVSGRADQLGVFIPQRRPSGDIGQITGQTWELLGDQLAVFTLPHISWEAVIADTVRDTTTGEIVAAPRTWFTPFAADDGAPVSLTTLGKTLRPVEPLAALAALRSDYAGGADLTANFTLPFGLNATVDSGALVDGPITLLKPGMEAVDASFPGLQAGAQLRLTARFGLFQLGPHSMPGRASAPDGYAQALLDPAIATIWNQQFNDAAIPGRPPPDPPTRAVPVTRIDLSGYGASMVSDWVNPTDGTAIDQARFHVFVGRTSYELVEAQTYILPWNIPAVDATVFERDAAGYIARHNTGWRARDVPALRYGKPPPVLVEAGAVRDVRNVRNIRPSGGADIVVPSWGSYRPVLFDADVLLLTDTGPGSHGLAVTDPPNGVLASRGLVGYLRLTVAGPPTLDEASAVLQQVDALNAARAAGPIAADVLIASTGFGFSLTGIDVRAIQPVGSPQANIAVALRGTPHLPRDGAWSVTRRRATDPAPVPVDPLLPVPLVRLNAVPATWHIMEPDDLGFLAAGQDPPTTYGLLQSTGTQKMLLEHPTLVDGDPLPLRTKKTPALADVGSLLGIPGLLPDIGSLLQLPSLQGLTPKADGLQTAVVTQLLTIPPTVLLALGPIKVILGTATAKILGVPASPAPQSLVTLTLDPTAPPGKRWAITIDKASFMLTFDGFGAPDALVAVTGTLSAREGEGPGLSDIHVYYGDALALVTAVLQGIEAVAQFLPGGSKPPFSVDFSGSTLKIHESFGLPMLPLGFGFLQDIALEMGFEVDVLARKLRFSVGVGSEQDPFTWLVSPLAGNGLIALGATDQLGVEMQAGIGAGLGIDLAIASGSATVTLAVRIDTTQNPFILMVVLSGTAEVDVLDGLASASITLSAGLGVGVKVPLPPPLDPIEAVKETEVTLEAEIAVGIHISVCWVVHVDWTGSWPFRETVTGASLTGLLP
jgi:hypothetical protein